MKMLKYITFDRVLSLVIIIGLLILLKQCGGERDAARQRVDILDSTAQAAQFDRIETARRAREYRNNMQTAQFQAQQAAKKADSSNRAARTQAAEIRRLYALLSEPWPEDQDSSELKQQARYVVAKACCDSALALAGAYESLRHSDSLKDESYMKQLDLGTVEIDSLTAQLNRLDARYRKADSLARIGVRARSKKISLGVGGGFAPGFGYAGVSIMYSGPKGNHYQVDIGPASTGGMFYQGKILKTISFRKR